MIVRHTDAVEQTFALARRLGATAPAGLWVSLNGGLGAGKTAFAQGFAAGLGVGHGVVSPTFVIAQEHPSGRVPLVHVDLYRVEDAAALEQLGLEDRDDGCTIVLVEWAERFPELLPAARLEVEIELEGAGRALRLSATTPALQAWLDGALG